MQQSKLLNCYIAKLLKNNKTKRELISHKLEMSERKRAVTIKQLHYGFTLIELLVAITIIGILISVSTVAFNNARAKGRDNKRKQDLASISGALTLYFQDNGNYPCQQVFPTACVKVNFNSSETAPWIPGLVSGYIAALPVDSTSGRNYLYVVGADHRSYTVWANLENTSDSGILACSGAPSGYNYCVKPQF